MSQSSGKAKANKVNMLEDKSGKNTRALESKKKDLENNESKMGTHAGPSVGVSVTRKKFVTEMKSLKKRHVQKQDSDSDADENWVNFIESGGWSEDLV